MSFNCLTLAVAVGDLQKVLVSRC